ncbi:MAG TPA: hypothetical protein VIG30_01075 [Ktedonobacterales bacterium]
MSRCGTRQPSEATHDALCRLIATRTGLALRDVRSVAAKACQLMRY